MQLPPANVEDRRSRHGSRAVTALVVILMLALLGAAVFAVRARDDSRAGSSLVADERRDEDAIRAAENAFLARNGRYGTEAELVDAGLLPAASQVHDVALENTGTLGSKPRYVIDCAEPGCGVQSEVPELRFPAQSGFGISPFTASGSPNPMSIPMMTLMFDTLTWRDASGAVPWLTMPATAVPPGMERTPAGGLVSGDHLQYRYTLRDGVNWQDGRVLTPDDVVFTFDYMKGRKAAGFSLGFPPPGGPAARFIDYIASVGIDPSDPTGRTILFTLHDPAANPCPADEPSCLVGPWVPFEDSVIGAVPIIPRHVWGPDANSTCKPGGGAGNTCVDDPVNSPPDGQYMGSGPYVLDQDTFDPDTLVAELDANPAYFKGRPYVRRIRFVPVGAGQGLNALKTGVVDGADVDGDVGITPEALEPFSSMKQVSGDKGEDRAIQFNLTRGFPFDRKEFRQAIAYALDRPALVRAILDGRGGAGSPGGLSPSSPALADGLPTYERNLEKANQLLDSIGVVDTDGDGKRNLPAEGCGMGPPCAGGAKGTKLWSDSPTAPLAAIVADSLREDLYLDVVAFSPEPPLFVFGNYSMALLSQENLTGDPDQLRRRFSDRVTGQTFPGPCADLFGCRKNPPIMVFGYANQSFMDLADQQAVDFDPASRLAKVHQMEALLGEDVPATSVMVVDRLFVHRPGTVPFFYTPGGLAGSQAGSTLNKQVFVTGKRTG